MSTYSVADAKNQLSELIDRALRGEGVVITRYGRPMVELKPIDEPARAVSAADLDWLAAHRVGRMPTTEDAGALVERLRDEGER
jgi:prevent-host-death family protein